MLCIFRYSISAQENRDRNVTQNRSLHNQNEKMYLLIAAHLPNRLITIHIIFIPSYYDRISRLGINVYPYLA